MNLCTSHAALSLALADHCGIESIVESCISVAGMPVRLRLLLSANAALIATTALLAFGWRLASEALKLWLFERSTFM